MRKYVPLLWAVVGMTLYGSALAAANDERLVIPCDQPGANPGGATAMDAETMPCSVDMPDDVGNTSITGPKAPAKNRLQPRSETRRLPPPHSPDPHPEQPDR